MHGALRRCFASAATAAAPLLPPLPAAAAAAAHLLAPLLEAPHAPPLLDAHVHAALRDFLAAAQPQQARALAALHAQAAPPAAALARAAGASPLALPFLAAVRRSCAASSAASAPPPAPWARAVDAAALATLRPLYGPALTPLQQLRLPGGGGAALPPWMPALLAAAQGSDSVRPAADAREWARKFGWRRLVHGLHHAAQPEELLAVLYTALLPGVPASLAALEAQSGGQAPAPAAAAPPQLPLPTTAAFYSVGSPASVARGLRLGTRIIYALAGALAEGSGSGSGSAAPAALPEARALTTFCTLSPVPGFVPWLRGVAAGGSGGAAAAAAAASLEQALRSCDGAGAAGARALLQRYPGASACPSALAPRLLQHLQAPRWWEAQGEGSAALRALAAAALEEYLLRTPSGGDAPACKVAAFHLGNGARLTRLCGGGDPSPSGLARSAGFLVSYLYSDTGAAGLRETQHARAAEFAASPRAVLAAQRPAVVWSSAGREQGAREGTE
jgi:malonyl-CoA decarboxylase